MKKLLIPILLLILLFSACGTGHPETLISYKIKNATLHPITLKLFNAGLPNQVRKDTVFSLEVGFEMVYEEYFDGENVTSKFPIGPTDSAHIIFNSQKQLIFIRDTVHPRNIINIDSWEGEKQSNTYYKYTYTITNEDYEMAEEIK